MKNFFSLLLMLTVFSAIQANSTITIQDNINWQEGPIIHNPTGYFPTTIYTFENASFSDLHPTLPVYANRVPVDGFGSVRARLVNTTFESFNKAANEDDQYIGADIEVVTKVFNDRGQYYVYYNFIPIRKTGNSSFERLLSFELVLDFENSVIANPRNDYTYNSELESGDIYKISVTETGLHKLSYSFLKNDVGIDIDNIDPAKIRILGIGGGMLPEIVDEERVDDFEELSIQIIGEGDGQFNESDYILFYAEGPDKWYYQNDRFTRPKNVYSDVNYYIIKIGSQDGMRVGNQATIASTSHTTNEYDSYQRLEEERYNLLNDALGTQGSGRHWYGDPFNPTRERNYSFTFPEMVTSKPVDLKVAFVARGKNSSRFNIDVAGENYISTIIGSVSFTNTESTYAKPGTISEVFTSDNNTIDITLNYPSVGDGTNQGWLDYIELNTRSTINLRDAQIRFRDKESLQFTTTTFQVSGTNNNTAIWDITNPFTPAIQEANLNGSQLSFGTNTQDELKEFVAFQPEGNLPSPDFVEQVENQNIHAFENVHMAIIYHKDFEDAARRLAEHRAAHSNLDIALVDLDQVFNEFAAGRRDMTAVRDFTKMLYDRNPDKFNYLLLFGDGSFDFKDYTNQGQNFLPPFETRNSLDPIRSFPSDDFFALLTEGEGAELIGALDIAVGRIPSRTVVEADAVVQKIIDYDTNPNSLNDWRNRLTFVADDEDSNAHINQADGIAERMRLTHKVFNVNKIYFDAYQQEPTPGGERFPKANEAINRDIFKGTLVLNYMGHGGSKGWAQERVLTNDDIASWTNYEKLPLFVTATCSFTGYDEPSITTAGEQAFLKSDGGVIGLFTTTRAVYSSANNRLTNAVFDTIFQTPGLDITPIGEILRLAKNANPSDTLSTNSRKFTLIGDPSMTLAIPQLNVSTTKINGIDVSTGTIDTIQALQEVTIEGMITDHNGNPVTDFNGTISPTVYDKLLTVSTLVQDPGSRPKDFNIRQNIIFKGNASVTNGVFSFSFVVPKDINYEYGFGKISYYASDGVNTDARGNFNNFIIGGTDPNAIADDQGPLVEVFMDNESFVFGGITNPNPTLLVKLSDDLGINVVGNSIGHDLTAVMDQNTQETYILNDFYESELDDYTRGEVRFPLFELEEGLHTIEVKAWDVANNSGEGYTEFLVASDEDIALEHVLNYPNPFTTSTNFQFEHNIKNQGVDVQIQVFTVSGKIVKTIETTAFTDGGRISNINWDGTDDYGDRLGKGVYLYKVKVRSDDQKTTESDFEKLVILK